MQNVNTSINLDKVYFIFIPGKMHIKELHNGCPKTLNL